VEEYVDELTDADEVNEVLDGETALKDGAVGDALAVDAAKIFVGYILGQWEESARWGARF